MNEEINTDKSNTESPTESVKTAESSDRRVPLLPSDGNPARKYGKSILPTSKRIYPILKRDGQRPDWEAPETDSQGSQTILQIIGQDKTCKTEKTDNT